MRNAVQELWDNAMNPENEERMIDLFSFLTLVFNGQITQVEMKELMRGQI